jgi:hypothetical protein
VEEIKLHIFVYNFFSENRGVWGHVEKYFIAGQATNDYTAPPHFMLDTKDYKHIIRICNTCCFSYATMVERTLSVPLENNDIVKTIT